MCFWLRAFSGVFFLPPVFLNGKPVYFNFNNDENADDSDDMNDSENGDNESENLSENWSEDELESMFS